MIRLPSAFKAAQEEGSSGPKLPQARDSSRNRISIRDKLLVQEVGELERSLPPSCRASFPSTSSLHSFTLTIRPQEGYYTGGTFLFQIDVPPEYNNAPPAVKCLTRVWHPNISEEGAVCLSILRQTSLDSLGWSPTRRLKDVIWGLNSLFSDLLDFDDPLNIEAAEHFRRDPRHFEKKVKKYISQYC